MALRYPAADSLDLSGRSIASTLQSECGRLGAEIAQVDVILDLGYLRPDDLWSVGDVAEIVEDIASGGNWRNLILMATSIPKSLSEVSEGSIVLLPRREWLLWTGLRERHIALSFGDYGVQHPRAPDDKGGGRMRANIRYPTQRGILVARGRGPIGDLHPNQRAEEYRRLCRQIVASPYFAGADCCWGCTTILDCAEGRLEPGPQSMWRGAGTSHSLQEVVRALPI